jgi:ABC-type sugar transport system ATPase subunit
MTVYKNMACGLKIAGENQVGIARRVQHAATILEIDHLLQRLPRELSGGQHQRVAIVHELRLFLFDEPLSNLDAVLRVQTRLEIAKLHRQLAATIVYVTHDQVEAMTLGDKIVIMSEGRIEPTGAPLALYQQPSNLFVATFIGSPKMNLFTGKVSAIGGNGVRIALTGSGDDVLACVYANVDPGNVMLGDAVTVGLRAEHIDEHAGADANSHTHNRFDGSVNIVEYLGEVNFIYLTLANGQVIVLRGDGNFQVHIGAPLTVSAPATALHVFDRNGRALRPLKPGNMIASRRID